MHVFWLLGPFILLIERSPADLWLSVIALTFAGRSIGRREGWWLRVAWVRLAFLFWIACLVSAAFSPLPVYSLVETFLWFRFPLFGMAVAFWLGRDQRMVHAMLLSIGTGMLIMCLILAAEIAIVGVNEGVFPGRMEISSQEIIWPRRVCPRSWSLWRSQPPATGEQQAGQRLSLWFPLLRP